MKNTFLTLVAIFCMACGGNAQEQNHWSAKDRQIFEQLPRKEQSVADWAKYLLGTPYKSATLESSNDSICTVNLQAFDCTTFVENVVALSLIDTISPQYFTEKLTHLRYRDGIPKGYSSRLHYFMEWISDNEQKGLVKDITKELGGKPVEKQIDFMTMHRKFYPALGNQVFFEKIGKIEKQLSQQLRYVIPKEEFSTVTHAIQDGDIIAFATGIKGLDFVHLGFAIHDEQTGNLCLLHASSKAGKVIISKDSVADYALQRSDVSGIVVLRITKK